MNDGGAFSLAGETLRLLPSGALHWPGGDLLCVSDLHLGKSERIARRGGCLLPPYEVRDTLLRLQADIATTGARTVVCLGDSFDDCAAAGALDEEARLWIARLQAGRRWIWIEGNHDPGPLGLPGSHLAELAAGPLVFRHIAKPGSGGDGRGEISGHYHPKAAIAARGRRISRPCALVTAARAILPAYGTYTGGLSWTDPALRALMGERGARAILVGPVPHTVPVPVAAPKPERAR